MFGSCGTVGTSAVVHGVLERTLIGEHVAGSLTAFPTHRLFIESVFGVMANVGALPLDCDVLHEVREVHEDAVRQTDHDDDLRAVAVPSPLFQGDPVNLAQDAVPLYGMSRDVLFKFGNSQTISSLDFCTRNLCLTLPMSWQE